MFGQKVRQELQGRVEELKLSLRAAEQRLVECEKRLLHSERMCSEKSWSIVQLQAKVCTIVAHRCKIQ